jgi:hypothetical protein
MRDAVLKIGLVVAGTAAGFAATAPSVDARMREQVAREDDPGPQGGSSALEVRFAPVVVSANKNRSTAHLRIDFSSRAKTPTTATYVIEFVDDHGNALVAPSRGPNIQLAAGAQARTNTFETPTGLTDGFYMARATIVAIGGGASSQLRRVYFEARAGELHELEIADYLSRSDANKGDAL